MLERLRELKHRMMELIKFEIGIKQDLSMKKNIEALLLVPS
jgi:hypothetical protein